MKMSKDIEQMTNDELNTLYNSLFTDLSKQLGDSKSNLLLILEIERELTIREEKGLR